MSRKGSDFFESPPLHGKINLYRRIDTTLFFFGVVEVDGVVNHFSGGVHTDYEEG